MAAATVTPSTEPRISAPDGHFLHGRWTISTSVACIEDEEFAAFTHGRVEILTDDSSAFDDTLAHWMKRYGSSPQSWGGTILMRVIPTCMVGYAGDLSTLLAARGVDKAERPRG